MERNNFFFFLVGAMMLMIMHLSTVPSYSQLDNWTQYNGPYGGLVYTVILNGSNERFAGTLGGVFKAPNNSDQWAVKNTGLTNKDIRAIVIVSGTNYFAAAYDNGNDTGGVFRSLNGGESWTRVNTGITNRKITNLYVQGTTIYATATGGQLFISTNYGNSWTLKTVTGITSTLTGVYTPDNTNIFVSSYGNGVYYSSDGGGNWISVNSGLPAQAFYVNSIASSQDGAIIYIGTNSGIYKSNNFGSTWTAANSGLSSLSINRIKIDPFAPTNIYACTQTGGVNVSNNDGTNWTPVNTGLTNNGVLDIAFSNVNYYIATYGSGVFKSPRTPSINWSPMTNGFAATVLINSIYRPSTTTLFTGSIYSGVFAVNVNSGNWSNVTNELPAAVYSFADDGTAIYAGTASRGVWKSTNNGANWFQLGTSGLADSAIRTIFINGSDFYVGTLSKGIYYSNDGGNTWTARNNGFPGTPAGSGVDVRYILSYSGNLYAAVAGNGIYRSPDNGMNWTAINAGLPPPGNDRNINHILVNDNTLYICGRGIWKSIDNGDNWTADTAGLPYKYVYNLVSTGGFMYASTFGIGVYQRPSSGGTWLPYNNNWFLPMEVRSLSTDGTYLYAPTYGNGMWRALIPSGIRQITTNVPDKYNLEQNFPNPFNPSTTIRFQIPFNSFVNLSLYDINGRLLEQFVNSQLQAGIYEYKWNASKYASGIYFYRLTTNNYIATKKMILVK